MRKKKTEKEKRRRRKEKTQKKRGGGTPLRGVGSLFLRLEDLGDLARARNAAAAVLDPAA